jgi:hypothetical protein
MNFEWNNYTAPKQSSPKQEPDPRALAILSKFETTTSKGYKFDGTKSTKHNLSQAPYPTVVDSSVKSYRLSTEKAGEG